MNIFSAFSSVGKNDIPVAMRIRHILQVRPARVAAVQAISPHLRHIILASPALRTLVSDGFADHVKLLLPPPGVAELAMPSISERGLPAWPAGSPQPIARDYTPLHINQDQGQLTLAFSLHGDGPAAQWAARAQPGDAVLIGGPRGSAIWPTDLQWQWLIGDESALPAIQRRLAELPASVAVTVLLDLAHPDEPLPPLALGGTRRLYIVPRPAEGSPERITQPLLEALATLPRPDGRGFAWVATERHSARAVRAWLLDVAGLPKGQVRATAYWQRGVSNHHENLED